MSPAMLGVPGKRKLECPEPGPGKTVRLDDDWRSDSTSTLLAATLVRQCDRSSDHEDMDSESDDSEEEDERVPGYNCSADSYAGYYSQQEEAPQPQYRGYQRPYWAGYECYTPPQPQPQQQTIRCAENGKSYLDLGSSTKCCASREDASRTALCYRQRRLAVLNISMCKLGRYRQFPDPSLHRSVLICNTLRYIEREMEQEGFWHSQTPLPPPAPQPELLPVPSGYENSLREMSNPGRATPFPGASSGSGSSSSSSSGSSVGSSSASDVSSSESINWGSVLSLSSQSDLEPLNNNDLLGDVDISPELDEFLPSWKLTPLSADDILKSVPPEGELDSIMHVLVGT